MVGEQMVQGANGRNIVMADDAGVVMVGGMLNIAILNDENIVKGAEEGRQRMHDPPGVGARGRGWIQAHGDGLQDLAGFPQGNGHQYPSFRHPCSRVFRKRYLQGLGPRCRSGR